MRLIIRSHATCYQYILDKSISQVGFVWLKVFEDSMCVCRIMVELLHCWCYKLLPCVVIRFVPWWYLLYHLLVVNLLGYFSDKKFSPVSGGRYFVKITLYWYSHYEINGHFVLQQTLYDKIFILIDEAVWNCWGIWCIVNSIVVGILVQINILIHLTNQNLSWVLIVILLW